MTRVLTLVYGFACYGVFFGTFFFAIGFVGNMIVPKAVDCGAAGAVVSALLVNALLLGVFAIQHCGISQSNGCNRFNIFSNIMTLAQRCAQS